MRKKKRCRGGKKGLRKKEKKNAPFQPGQGVPPEEDGGTGGTGGAMMGDRGLLILVVPGAQTHAS